MGNIIKKTLLVVAGKSFPVTISEENDNCIEMLLIM